MKIAVVNVENGELITTVNGEVVKKGECKFIAGDYSVYVEKTNKLIDVLDRLITEIELCLILNEDPEERSSRKNKLEQLKREKQSIEEAEEAKEVSIEYSNGVCFISYNGKRLKVEDTKEIMLKDVVITVINNKQKEFSKLETEDYVLLHKKGYLEIFLNEKFLNKPVKIVLDYDICPEVIFKTSSFKNNPLIVKLPDDDMELDLDKLKNVLKVIS